MILVGSVLILVGTQTISVYDNWMSGLLSMAMGGLLIYGRFKLEK